MYVCLFLFLVACCRVFHGNEWNEFVFFGVFIYVYAAVSSFFSSEFFFLCNRLFSIFQCFDQIWCCRLLVGMHVNEWWWTKFVCLLLLVFRLMGFLKFVWHVYHTSVCEIIEYVIFILTVYSLSCIVHITYKQTHTYVCLRARVQIKFYLLHLLFPMINRLILTN